MGFVMFVDNNVLKELDDELVYDRFAIASTMVDVSLRGATCSIIEAQVMKDCTNCNLKYICKKLDGIAQEYAKKTTVIIDSFSFGN
jgi:hypothetical protein